MSNKVINPTTGMQETVFSLNNEEDLHNALVEGDKYYRRQRQVSVKYRAQQLMEIAASFRANAQQLAQTATNNMGKLISESLAEVEAAAKIAEYYAKNGPNALESKPYTYAGEKHAEIQYESTGIVVAIEPWNFPYTQVMRVFAPNFLLGNPVVLKYASIVADCALEFEQTVINANVDQAAIQNMFLTNNQVAELIKDQRIQGVALTGSTGAGRAVASEAGQALTKVTLELGGNDAFIVLKDADVQQAIKDGATSRLRNAGQVCTSAKRFIIHEAVAKEFIDGMITEFNSRVIGDPNDEKTTLAPLASQKGADMLQWQVDTAIENGAEVLVDGGILKQDGNFFKPVLLTNLQRSNPMFDQEFFGPVGQVYVVKSNDEAIKLANQSQYGLAGAVYSQSIAEAKSVANQLETGQVFINQPSNGYPELPFGGVKNSGFGREMSELALFEFANQKMIALG